MSNFSILLRNIIALYGLTFAKLVLPMITFPYLTRVMSLDTYGLIAYVGTIMGYLQVFVDFGFMLSGTKDIIDTKNDLVKMGIVAGDIAVAKIINAIFVFGMLCLLIIWIPILRKNYSFVIFSYCSVVMSIFLFDYLFRGLEEMQVVTYRFVLVRIISIILIFSVVRGDSDLMWMPGLTLIGDIVACAFTYYEIWKRGIVIKFTCISNAIQKLKQSAVYFLSDAATTLFGEINAVLIGIFLPASDVAFWAIAMKIVVAIQSMYSPITTGLYARMVAEKSWKLLRTMAMIFVPLVAIGCGFTYCVSDYAIILIAGKKYLPAAELLRWLIPWIFFGFPAMLFGWPALGSIGKSKQVTYTTICTGAIHIIGLVVFVVNNNFTLFSIAILRDLSEGLFFVLRFGLCMKYRRGFND